MSGSGMDERVYCPDCRRATEVVLDHGTGDTICTECALVLDAHYVDEGSEWRTFSGDAGAGEDRDPSRVGSTGDPFLNAQLSTFITNSKKPNAAAHNALPRMSVPMDAGAASDKALVDGFRGISDLADRLGLVATIRDLAKETFKKLDDAKACPRGRNRDAVYAACLYIACRNLGMPRTFKELASVTAQGAASRKDIGKISTHIKRLLGDDEVTKIGVVRAADYLRRFCSRLSLANHDVRVAEEAVRRLEGGLDVRRNPESIAAAIIYMVVQRAGTGSSVKDVSGATGVAEGTIKDAQKELTPHAQMLFG
ncbi:unnamed protein product [Alopecurus aequalis]